MKEKDIYKILKVVLKAIKGKKFVWRLEGSVNLKIQGVEVLVKDFDITTNDNGISLFRDALRDYVVKDFFSEKIRKIISLQY